MSSRAGYRIGKVELIVRAEGPDKIALFAIRPALIVCRDPAEPAQDLGDV